MKVVICLVCTPSFAHPHTLYFDISILGLNWYWFEHDLNMIFGITFFLVLMWVPWERGSKMKWNKNAIFRSVFCVCFEGRILVLILFWFYTNLEICFVIENDNLFCRQLPFVVGTGWFGPRCLSLDELFCFRFHCFLCDYTPSLYVLNEYLAVRLLVTICEHDRGWEQLSVFKDKCI